MGTFHSWPLPRYLQGHLCIFDNKRPLGCHDFDDSSPPRIVLADALETKNRHLTRLCDCDIVSGPPRHCGVYECASGLITKIAHVWPASNVLSLASKSSEATIRHMILSLLLSGRKQSPLHLRPFSYPFSSQPTNKFLRPLPQRRRDRSWNHLQLYADSPQVFPPPSPQAQIPRKFLPPKQRRESIFCRQRWLPHQSHDNPLGEVR